MKGDLDIPNRLYLINEMETLKETVNSLQNVLFSSEEEKQLLQKQFENKLDLINTLRLEIEDWKSKFILLQVGTSIGYTYMQVVILHGFWW